MKILALELSTTEASLAWLDREVEVVREWRNDRKNSGMFFENLQQITKQMGLPERIIVGLGPGSYAGIRIAISAAIGLQSAVDADLAGCPSICAMPTDADDFLVVGDARRRSFYWARVCGREVVGDFQLYEETELREKLNNLDPDRPVFSADATLPFNQVRTCHPSAIILARLARSENVGFSLPPLEPIYLREPHITKPKSQVPAR